MKKAITSLVVAVFVSLVLPVTSAHAYRYKESLCTDQKSGQVRLVEDRSILGKYRHWSQGKAQNWVVEMKKGVGLGQYDLIWRGQKTPFYLCEIDGEVYAERRDRLWNGNYFLYRFYYDSSQKKHILVLHTFDENRLKAIDMPYRFLGGKVFMVNNKDVEPRVVLDTMIVDSDQFLLSE